MTWAFVIGGVSYNTMIYLDHLPKPAPQMIFSRGSHETVGDTGAGKALNLARLGFDVTLYSLLAKDEAGQKVISQLSHEPLISLIYDEDPLGTARHLNLMDSEGQRISIYVNGGSTNATINWAHWESVFAESDYIILNINPYCRGAIPLIQKYHQPIWCDIHDYDGVSVYHKDFIAAATYIFMSSDRMPDYRPFMETLIDEGRELVVCTHGKRGSTALTADKVWIEMPIQPYLPVVDTNGAGDAFFAGFLYGHAQGYDVQRCMQYAVIASGLCVTSYELASPELSVDWIEADWRKFFGSASA